LDTTDLRVASGSAEANADVAESERLGPGTSEALRRAALDLLHRTFGYRSFRPLQEDVIKAILDGRDAFVLMPTGGGKSLCYQVPALLFDGMTVVVSPLIALMKDQVDALTTLGVAATYVNSSLSSTEIQIRQQAVARGDVKLLYVAPERFATQRFLSLLHHVGVSMFAIDEAHCISEWGHDFRPDYRELRLLRERFPETIISAFTATATDQVQSDIRQQLGLLDAVSFRASFNRPNLFYEVRPKQDAYGQISAYLQGHRSDSGIIYCGSRTTTEDLAARLRAEGYDASAYHAGLDSDRRQQVQEAFVRDDVRIIVATIAFGMGIDKPDVRFVIHYDLPKSVEGYYQESGRAGRDGDAADCILFYTYGDVARQQFFINQRPTQSLREAAALQLRQMSTWAEVRSCRRSALLEYFGEAFDGQDSPCCDNCRNPPELVDFTIPAQKFLSCVVRTGERFGSGYIIDVLRGSRAERILRLGHDRLSTYGIGRDQSKHEWQYLARELVKRGFAIQDPEQFNSIRVTNAGQDVLFRAAEVLLPAAPDSVRSRSRDVEASTHVAHPELFELLRQLRKRIADERRVPPYVIFPDSTLRVMAASLPHDPRSLRAIAGVGERKLVDFGGEFLREIREYVERTGAESVEAAAPRRTRQQRNTGLGPSIRHTLALFHEGRTPEEIAEERRLAPTTVEDHLVEAIESGEGLDINRLVQPDRRKIIESTLMADPDDGSLRGLMDRTGGAFTYAELKLTRAAFRAGRAGERNYDAETG
jgi:ATP-dependent DNA helicase RecQ